MSFPEALWPADREDRPLDQFSSLYAADSPLADGSLLILKARLQDRFDNFSGMHLLKAFMPIVQAPTPPNDRFDIELTVSE